MARTRRASSSIRPRRPSCSRPATLSSMAERRARTRVAGRPRLLDDRQSLPIALLRAREAVMAWFRPHHRKGGVTEQQWRVIRMLHLDGEMEATELARRACLL